MEIDTEDSDNGKAFVNNLDTDSEDDSLDLGMPFSPSLYYSSRALSVENEQSDQTVPKDVYNESNHVTHTSPPRDEQRGTSTRSVTRAEPTFSEIQKDYATPVQESAGGVITVLLQEKALYKCSLYGGDYLDQDTPVHVPDQDTPVHVPDQNTPVHVPDQVSSVTPVQTYTPSMTSAYWYGGVQEQGKQWSVRNHLGSDPSSQTGVFVDTQRLQTGQGRPPLDAFKCAHCKQRTVGVSQRPCGHIVCVTCQPPYMGDKCKLCHQEVYSVVGYDPTNLRRQ